ncbi:MAG: class I SAM-dependent methyltransferase [Gammaproteobacteria bacterium]|nr:class I SAM-dependent methyltransferase [Gammaproteobacteria bacterium]
MDSVIDHTAGVDFVLALRRRWADTLYPALQTQLQAGGQDAELADTESRVRALPAYPWFSWLERGSQKMLWRAVIDALDDEAPGADDALAASVEMDEQLELPDWYTDWDIHLQPGGVWSSQAAASVYELGARLVMLGENDDYAFHRVFVETALPQRAWRRIVDLGCGFGKSTWPFKAAFPQAEVIGVDLAAPCLQLAARRAAERGLDIRLRQADATATGLEDASADLVTSTMLIHEMPVEVLRELFAECVRILAPGGVLRFLDFQFTGDALRDMAMREHGARNNEPYLPAMMQADLIAFAEAAGLVNARWVAFDERGAGRLPELRWPRRAEWHFPWAVLEAEKPR